MELRINNRGHQGQCPGGLSAQSLVDYAWTNYGVTLTLEMATMLRDVWFDTFPEMNDFFGDVQADEETTARLLWQHLRSAGLLDQGIETVSDLRNWMRAKGFPKEQVQKTLQGIQRYCQTTIAGTFKRDCTFTAALNLAFQSGAASGAKYALYMVDDAGFRIIDFIHVPKISA